MGSLDARQTRHRGPFRHPIVQFVAMAGPKAEVWTKAVDLQGFTEFTSRTLVGLGSYMFDSDGWATDVSNIQVSRRVAGATFLATHSALAGKHRSSSPRPGSSGTINDSQAKLALGNGVRPVRPTELVTIWQTNHPPYGKFLENKGFRKVGYELLGLG